ncbi:TetR family transcriptional regulator [Streptacidiphilus pinicola]|uniref:TetR family transcriptional regulator n=1 Tax=Streptacidiphilus pinicola TaxID=2219663 RepID=A0A2X0JWP5_9ACTN|nr:TetR/AcrR family transcriptional regulator [Streptacidiphilus pinicola]RAG81375.1 TetR family transcriptional regulator [Streptacidiphilus pinicola]
MSSHAGEAVDSEFENLIGHELGRQRATAPAGPPEAAAAPPPAKRGRPRSEAVEASIVEGMLRLMAEGSSLAGLSVEAIAAEAGVGKATIYRRWPDKDAMLLHLLQQLESKLDPICERATLRETLIAAVDSIRVNAVNRRSGSNLAMIGAEIRAIPDLYARYHEAVIEPRRRALRELVRAAQLRGELRDDIDADLLGELVVGPMLSRAVLHPDASIEDPSLAATIVDAVLQGVAVRPGGPETGLSSNTHPVHSNADGT